MGSEFNFFQHWYPISTIEDLDPKRPTPVTLLGQRLVIWKPPTTAQYCVFLDECPHRLAPLSEGRVDEKTGDLMCSYHGWQFDSAGQCTRIPQADNPELLAKKQLPCAVALPCQQQNDLLWVWPDIHSVDIAQSTPLPLSPMVDASKGFVWSSFVRDVEYDWQTLVENVVDPSHVPFAHHGVQGNRDKARPIPITIEKSTQELMEASSGGIFQKITFEPPCHIEYAINFGNQGKHSALVVYCIPVAPGKSRIVGQFPRNFAKTLFRLTPRWFDHITNRNLVIEGDMILLHHQEQGLQERKHFESWKDAYHLLTSADRLVIEFRKWFDKYCHGQLPWGDVIPAHSDPQFSNREALLNRYEQHTKICKSCSVALQRLQRLQFILLAYFAVTVAGVAVMPDNLRVNVGLPLTVLALLGLGAYVFLKYRLEPKFYFVDYVHPEK